MPSHFFEALIRHAERRGDAHAVCLVDGRGEVGQAVTYRQLRQAVEAAAADFSTRLPRGAAVLLRLPNGIGYITTFLALLRAGMSVFPIHSTLSEAEKNKAIADSAAAAEIGEDGFLTLQSPISNLHSPSLLLRSSGTTGLPKLVSRDGPSLDAVARNTAHAVGLSERDRVLVVIPLCHSYGIENGLLAPLFAGATLHVCRGFDPAVVLRQWREGGITVMPGVPFMFEVLAQTGEKGDAKNLRSVYSAGATLPRGVFNSFQLRHGLTIGQLYGATEIGSVTFNDPRRPGFDPAGVGPPMEGVEIRILDPVQPTRPLPAGTEGHVAIKAPSMLSHYLGGEPEPLADGFFLTGDLGRLDGRGALTITGRLKLLIDIGGMKVNPLEIEALMMTHPAVRECVVVPVPVSVTLVRIKAFVTLRDRAVNAEELRRFARQALAGYKVPRLFETLEEMPKSPTGKILRQTLMERVTR